MSDESPNKSRWQKDFDALPEWAQQMVRGLAECGGYGMGDNSTVSALGTDSRRKYEGFSLALKKDAFNSWFDGFLEMKDLAEAMTAPWPKPVPEPHEEMTTDNIVEMMTAGDDDCAFDQPCHYGHRVESHAVYCHCDAWPDAPRKCRRNRDDFKHEDCPGFYPNAGHGEPKP